MQDATVAAMARVLAPSGEFRFVSDIDDYCAWTLAHLSRSPDFHWMAERADDWRKPWKGYTMTRYGRKAEREGRVTAYLRFQRVGQDLAFPAIRALFASVASHTMRLPRSRPNSSIGS